MIFDEDRTAADQPQVISYLNAFNGCPLVAELVKWVSSLAGIENPNSIPDITNPRALISELLHLLFSLVYFSSRSLNFFLGNY